MEIIEDRLKEEWRPIKEYEGRYEVSNFGRIKSVERIIVYPSGKKQPHKEKIMRPQIVSPRQSAKRKSITKYQRIMLCKNGKYKGFLIHRLVAEAFIPNPENKPEVNHIDGCGLHNHVKNLEWTSSTENKTHSYNILYQGNIKPVSCIETGEEYPSLTSAAKELGVSVGSIWNSVAYGQSIKGLHFERKD